ncbi:MAG: prepilin peptidase [Methylomonas sp.]
MDKLLWLKGLLIAWALGFALIDYRQRRLPNSLTLGAGGAAIIYLLIYGRSVLGASPLSATTAGISALLLLSPCLWLGWLGAGDVKVMSAIGFIGGIQILAATFVLSSFLTLPVALWFSVGKSRQAKQNPSQKLRLPQGVFIALGLMLAMLAGNGVSSA